LKNFSSQGVEIISYDTTNRTFQSDFYSDMSGNVLPYQWDVHGNTVTHWMKGAKHAGTFSEGGNTLDGGWRPDEGSEATTMRP
jgi:hypothetical protein